MTPMAVQRTLRMPKRPKAYAALVVAAAAILAVCVAGTWRLAHETHEAPADIASS